MKRINITIGLLFIYFLVLSIIGFPKEQIAPDGTDRLIPFILVCMLELIVLFLLRWALIKRHKFREHRRRETEQYAHYEDETDKLKQ